ncbi:hypothetical protein VOLCADRAFT_85966 [Volvox carteri f. nagariensis]|uniref:Uncharacterized protein n=1 Tax=Volvox carteri f. nagariensis TaxID=3068 RepID=D8THG5_VOLCA|nr:uncharacterized protein VOLCADRAFT_85966 [Volvox carteri f. nagariensis]EFJ53066.1 hypothetical protein VOLCADRAFT_85966 [Volvox carteri f. nagariensis]|eukprot:XP_002946071.1 hypothetical protein VOLCADRAFT_85966 [Volvox carteri f. nagariensis]
MSGIGFALQLEQVKLGVGWGGEAVRGVLPELSSEEDDYMRRVSLAVLQEARGSNVFFADLDFLHAALVQQLLPAAPELNHFAAHVHHHQLGGRHQEPGLVHYDRQAPRNSRTAVVLPQILRRATEMVGARHDGNKDVVAGVWGRVDVGTFVEACRQVMAGLRPDEEQYIAALASEQVPSGSPYIRDLPFLDKCLQQGRTPTSIKGPDLLPAIFLNTTTSGQLDGGSLRHTGGRIF